MNYKVLNSRERKKFWKAINSQFGTNVDVSTEILLNNDEYFIVNSKIHEIPDIKVYSAGLSFAKEEKNGLVPSMEGSQFLGKTATKQVLNLSDDLIADWVKGNDLDEINADDGLYLVKNKKDFFGAGQLKAGRLVNKIPKARRLINIHSTDSTSLA